MYGGQKRVGIINPSQAKYATEIMTAKKTLTSNALGFLRNSLLYIVFLSMFTTCMFLQRNAEIDRNMLVNVKERVLSSAQIENPLSPWYKGGFSTLDAFWDFWDVFLNRMFLGSANDRETWAEDPNIVKGNSLSAVDGALLLLGAMRLRQVRVQSYKDSTCINPPREFPGTFGLKDEQIRCFPELTQQTVSTTTFGSNREYEYGETKDYLGYDWNGLFQ